MPPSVLPAVATRIALQNRSGLSFSNPNSAGSEPIGNSVAEMNETMNSVLRPKRGSDNRASDDSIHSGMGADVTGARPLQRREAADVSFQRLKSRGPTIVPLFSAAPAHPPRMHIGPYR